MIRCFRTNISRWLAIFSIETIVNIAVWSFTKGQICSTSTRSTSIYIENNALFIYIFQTLSSSSDIPHESSITINVESSTNLKSPSPISPSAMNSSHSLKKRLISEYEQEQQHQQRTSPPSKSPIASPTIKTEIFDEQIPESNVEQDIVDVKPSITPPESSTEDPPESSTWFACFFLPTLSLSFAQFINRSLLEIFQTVNKSLTHPLFVRYTWQLYSNTLICVVFFFM